jgi:hypothetical protein
MRLNNFATFTSAALLATSIFIWRDLFFFSKTVHLPAWTAVLPSPIDTPLYLSFFCLLPAAFLTSTLSTAIRATAKAIFLAPLPTFFFLILSHVGFDIVQLVGVLFTYVWVVGFNCLAPALLLVAARAIASAVKGYFGG